jgi:hypothetical protein
MSLLQEFLIVYFILLCTGITYLDTYGSKLHKGGGRYFWILFFMYVIQHCFICHLSDSSVSEDAGIEPTSCDLALTARRSNHSARSHPLISFQS